MTLIEAIENANRIALRLQGLKIRTDQRSRIAAACFAVSQQHHNSILILLANNPPLNATAFALLRLLIEATIRGLWVSHCATDQQLEYFLKPEHKTLDTASMINAIGVAASALGNLPETFKSFYKNNWNSLSAYTHTGDLQVQRWLFSNDIKPNYSSAEVSEVVSRANDAGELAATGMQAITFQGAALL